MSGERTVPVFVEVTGEGGQTEQVRIGHAVRRSGGFVLRFGQVQLGVEAPVPGALPTDGPVEELEALAERSRRTLEDPKKARWHASERALLAAIEAEMGRKRKEAVAAQAPAAQNVG